VLKIRREKTFVKDLRQITMTDQQYQKYISYIAKLQEGKELPEEAYDHPLVGNWKDFREFHLGGDLILIYKIDKEYLTLVRIGSHAKIFKDDWLMLTTESVFLIWTIMNRTTFWGLQLMLCKHWTIV